MHYNAFYGRGKKIDEFNTGWVKIFDTLQSKKHLVMLRHIKLQSFQRDFYSSTVNSGQKDLLCWKTSGQQD